MDYREIAYKLGLMAEIVDEIRYLFTPDQDEPLAGLIVDLDRKISSAESHCLVAVDLEEMMR